MEFPSHPSGSNESSRAAAPVAADAAIQPVPIEPNESAKHFGGNGSPARPENTECRKAVFSILEGALRNVAAHKNVDLTAEAIARLADSVANHMDSPTAAGLVKGEQGSVLYAAAALNTTLDILAAKAMIGLIWRAEGFEEVDDAFLTSQACAWVSHGIAPHVVDNRFRWPDPIVMLKDYLHARCGGTASVVVPDGSKHRVAWFVDSVRCRAAAGQEASLAAFNPGGESGLKRPPAPVPQLIRCPGLPGTIGFQFPDGRCVKTSPHGGTATTWWRNGKLHRDPCAGPAMTVCDAAAGTTLREEYYRDGELHREDGPAAIMRRPDGSLDIELWYQNGQYHRDPGEGPALIYWNEQGTAITAVEYWRHGALIENHDRPAPSRRARGAAKKRGTRRRRS